MSNWTKEEVKVMKFLIKKNLEPTEPTKIKNLLVDLGYDKEESTDLYYLYKNNVIDGEIDLENEPDRDKHWEDFDPRNIALAIHLDIDPSEIEEEKYGYYNLKSFNVDGDIYAVGDDDACNIAAEDAAQSLIDEKLLSPNFMKDYIKMSETDRHLWSQDESDNYVDDLSDEDIIERGGIEDEIEEIDNKISELEDQQNELESQIEDPDEYEEKWDEINSEIEKLNSEKEDLINSTKEKIREEIYDETYSELEDPVEYFVEDRGIYTLEELMDNGPIFYDEDEMRKDIVRQDDRGTLLSNYDGVENEQDYDGETYYIYQI